MHKSFENRFHKAYNVDKNETARYTTIWPFNNNKIRFKNKMVLFLILHVNYSWCCSILKIHQKQLPLTISHYKNPHNFFFYSKKSHFKKIHNKNKLTRIRFHYDCKDFLPLAIRHPRGCILEPEPLSMYINPEKIICLVWPMYPYVYAARVHCVWLLYISPADSTIIVL